MSEYKSAGATSSPLVVEFFFFLCPGEEAALEPGSHSAPEGI